MKQRNRLVCGVGTNDADYEIGRSKRIGGRLKTLWICPVYRVWAEMLRRCYSEKYHDRYPTYRGCTVTEAWLSFSEFRAWMLRQDHEGNHLDKDLLFPGNKIYSPETCSFITPWLNNFLTESGASRGEWPIGVSWKKRAGKFVAQCRDHLAGVRYQLGSFDSPEPAHEAWRECKNRIAMIYADLQADPRVAEALRTRYAPSRRESGHHGDDSEYQVIEPTRLPHGPDECAKAQLDILSQE